MTHVKTDRSASSRYFATAAAGLMAQSVVDAMVTHLRREAHAGAIVAAEEASATISQGYAAAARLIEADEREIAFVESGNRALAALIQSVALQDGDHVLVDRSCWGGTVQMLSSYPGITIDVMPVDKHGRADVAATRECAHPATKLVVLTWCPATCGQFNPAEDVGALAQELGAFYIVDACQVVGQRPVRVGALGCHGLVASGRKWLKGPRGSALLYASRRFLAASRPFMADQFGRGRDDARRYETGEACIAARLGLSVALVKVARSSMADTARRLCERAASIRAGVAGLPGLTVIEGGPELAGFVTLDCANMPRALATLSAENFVISNPGRAYAPIDMDARGLSSVIRIAPHLHHNDDDIAVLVAALKKATG